MFVWFVGFFVENKKLYFNRLLEMEIKIIMWFYYILIRVVNIKKIENIVDESVELIDVFVFLVK